MTGWQDYLHLNKDRFLDEMLEFLRIPSVSALPEHAADVRQAGAWVMARINAAGVEHVEMLETGGHPVVYGDWLHAPGKPTVMIYGHFDVQPVDPLNLWTNPPFDPTVRDGRVYARGASDDKGNMLIPILATEALLRTEGRLPVNVKYFFEGQEEIGSPTLPTFIAANREKFACDMVISADAGQWDEEQPALMEGLRGLCALQVDVTGPNRDVHSGMFGGAIQNPIHALTRILDSLHGPDGHVLVEGFYDRVRALTPEDRALMAAIPLDDEKYKQAIGVDALYGETGFTTYERATSRPTLEVNGIYGGFQGAGTKTVIPSTAHAKITCRLVADQNPAEIAQLVKAQIERNTPPGARVVVTAGENGALPYLAPRDHVGNRAASAVLVEMYGKKPYYVRSGGSVPVCTLFLQSLGVYTVSFGFALEDELQHSPNEFFRIANFEKGQMGYCKLLYQLAG